jgi:DnaK suppressor protein
VSLTQSECGELEQRLAELARDVRDKIHETAPKNADERSLDRAGNALDEGDEAVSSMEEDFRHTLRQRYQGELQQLEAVRERLASGEIDRCVDCGGEIGFRRLLANPLAVRCIRCQAHFEKTHAGTAMPKL